MIVVLLVLTRFNNPICGDETSFLFRVLHDSRADRRADEDGKHLKAFGCAPSNAQADERTDCLLLLLPLVVRKARCVLLASLLLWRRVWVR